MSGKDSQNRTAMTGLPGQDSQGGTAKERTARTRQPGWDWKGEDSQDKTARMGLQRTGQPGQDSQDGAAKERTARSRHPEENCMDRSAKAGLSGQNNQDEIARTSQDSQNQNSILLCRRFFVLGASFIKIANFFLSTPLKQIFFIKIFWGPGKV
jgi:hypothetical protein